MSEIRISSAQLRSRADELNAQATQLDAQIKLLEETEQKLRASYEGDSSDAFHTRFMNNKEKLSNFHKAILQYIQAMRKVADSYDAAEARNVDIAST